MMTEKTPLRKKKAANPPVGENYTIFHALLEALKEKEERGDNSLFHRLKLRK